MIGNVLALDYLKFVFLGFSDADIEDQRFPLWCETIHVVNGCLDATKVSLDFLGILIDAMDVYGIAE